MLTLFTLFFWILFTVLVGVAAHTRNRTVIGWVIGSFFITPLIALLFILILGKIEKPSIAEQRQALGY